ncbi:MAG: tyrosine-type recombinase/integrase [Ignavibacteriales bacterium]|nr:tyrosine-type recombinase/integrase [Ignavibacteriales bacterium]
MENYSRILNKLSDEEFIKLRLILTSTLDNSIGTIINLEKLEADYINFAQSRVSASYLRSIRISFNHLLKYFSPNKLISQIDLKEIEQFIIYLSKNAPKGYKVYFRNLKAAFNKAISWGYLKHNHFSKIKITKTQKTFPIIISEDNLTEILKQIRKSTIKDMILLAYGTGLRINEIVQLTWSSVKLDERIIIVGSSDFTTKNREQRKIPINDFIFSIFSKYLRKVTSIKRKYIFIKSTGVIYSTDYVSKTFKKACRRAGLSEDIHFHTLRHTFASKLVQRGVSLYVVKELMGHSSIKTTEIYSHLDMQTLREAVEKLN